jgi:hypothetical protein
MSKDDAHTFDSSRILRSLARFHAKLDALQSRQQTINRRVVTLMASIDQLKTDFVNFQADFAAFVTAVQADLAKITAPGTLTQEQQDAVDSIDTAVSGMDATIKGIKL